MNALLLELAHSDSVIGNWQVLLLLLPDRCTDHFASITSHRCLADSRITFLLMIDLVVFEITIIDIASCLLLIYIDLLSMIRNFSVMV